MSFSPRGSEVSDVNRLQSLQADLAEERRLRIEAQELSQEMQVNVLLEGSKWKQELDKYKDALRHSSAASSFLDPCVTSAVEPNEELSMLQNSVENEVMTLP